MGIKVGDLPIGSKIKFGWTKPIEDSGSNVIEWVVADKNYNPNSDVKEWQLAWNANAIANESSTSPNYRTYSGVYSSNSGGRQYIEWKTLRVSAGTLWDEYDTVSPRYKAEYIVDDTFCESNTNVALVTDKFIASNLFSDSESFITNKCVTQADRPNFYNAINDRLNNNTWLILTDKEKANLFNTHVTYRIEKTEHNSGSYVGETFIVKDPEGVSFDTKIFLPSYFMTKSCGRYCGKFKCDSWISYSDGLYMKPLQYFGSASYNGVGFDSDKFTINHDFSSNDSILDNDAFYNNVDVVYESSSLHNDKFALSKANSHLTDIEISKYWIIKPMTMMDSNTLVYDSTDSKGNYAVEGSNVLEISGYDSDIGSKMLVEDCFIWCSIENIISKETWVEIQLDGNIIQTISSIVLGNKIKFGLTKSQWKYVGVGRHSLSVVAKDNEGNQAKRTVVFDKIASSIFDYKNIPLGTKVKIGKIMEKNSDGILNYRDLKWIVVDRNHKGYPPDTLTLISEESVGIIGGTGSYSYSTYYFCNSVEKPLAMDTEVEILASSITVGTSGVITKTNSCFSPSKDELGDRVKSKYRLGYVFTYFMDKEIQERYFMKINNTYPPYYNTRTIWKGFPPGSSYKSYNYVYRIKSLYEKPSDRVGVENNYPSSSGYPRCFRGVMNVSKVKLSPNVDTEGYYRLLGDPSGIWNSNKPPTKPSYIKHSALTDISCATGDKVTISWGQSKDPNGYDITYDLYFYNGNNWVIVIGNTADLNYTHVIPIMNFNTTNAKYKIRAYNGMIYSDFIESTPFSILKKINSPPIITSTTSI